MFHLNWFLPSNSQQLDVLVFFNDSVHWDNLNISHPSRLLRLFRTSALTPVESRWEKFHFPLKKWALVWRYVCFKKVFGIIGLKWRKRSEIRRCLYTYTYIYTHICTRIYEQTLHIYIYYIYISQNWQATIEREPLQGTSLPFGIHSTELEISG